MNLDIAKSVSFRVILDKTLILKLYIYIRYKLFKLLFFKAELKPIKNFLMLNKSWIENCIII